MKLADAKRLKPGTRVLCGNHQYTAKVTRWWTGEVVRVTPNGGVLVRIIEGKSTSTDWCGPGTGPDAGTEKWFPYNHIQRRP